MIRRLAATAIGGLVGAFFLDRWLGGLSVDDAGRPVRVPIRSRVEIDAPIREVWDVLADIERQPEWMTEMKAVRIVTPGPVGVGSRGEADVRILGITVSDPVEVVEFLPPHRFAIRHDGWFKGGGLITLDTTDGGRRTRVEWSEILVPPVLANLGSIAQGPILGRIFQADLERLRVIVEEDRVVDGAPSSFTAHALELEPPATRTNGHGVTSAG
jgi:uncharacterized membrane protein